MKPARSSLPIPAALLVAGALLALVLIVAAVVLALNGVNTIRSGIQVQILQEANRNLRPSSGSQLLYSGQTTLNTTDPCATTIYFEIFNTAGTMDTVRTHYNRLTQQHGWVQNPRTGSVYLTESILMDLVEPVPTAIADVRIPANVLATRAPGRILYAVVLTGWHSDRCPRLNRSNQLMN